MAKKKDTNKKYQSGNYYRTCGNCGLSLREDDEIIFVEQSIRSGSNYFHKHPEGCANASDKPMLSRKDIRQDFIYWMIYYEQSEVQQSKRRSL